MSNSKKGTLRLVIKEEMLYSTGKTRPRYYLYLDDRILFQSTFLSSVVCEAYLNFSYRHGVKLDEMLSNIIVDVIKLIDQSITCKRINK